jgi:type I restriction enzyme M protein
VNLVNPKFKETVYDPFCGTGGFLTQAFNHIKDNTLINTEEEKERLKEQTVFGSEITTNSRLAKMNMILHGDGHSGVKQLDSLENPIDGKYDVVITNMPFAQKTQSAHLYYNGIAKNSGDGVCLLHCFKSVKKGGRMAVIVPEGVLFRDSLKNVRKFLIDNAVLQTVVSLPQGVFLPYAGVKTNILYFTDCHSKKTKDKIWFFNVRNDGFTLDNHRKRIKDNDLKKVDYVDFLKRYDKESFLDLGFSETNLEKIKKNKYSLVGSFYVDNKFRNKKGFLPLKDVICVLEAGSRPRGGVSNISTGAISLGGEHIGIDGRITLKNIKYVPKDFYNKCKKGFVKQFDILICKDGALTGKAALFNDISLFNQKDIMVNEHVYIVRGNDKINQKYLFYMLRSHNLQNQIKEKAFNKSAQPGLNQTIMQNLLIPMPLLKEQHDIVSALDKKEAFIHKKREEAKTMDQSLRDDINKIWDTEKEGLPDEFFSLLEKTVRPLEE